MSRDAEQWCDEIGLREASLADAAREHATGELSDAQFAVITERDQRALALARAALEAFAVAPGEPVAHAPRLRQRRYLVVAALCFTVIIVMVLWSSLALRQVGTSGTGSLNLGHAQAIRQLLAEAEADAANGDYRLALAAYQQVLSLDARNVAALTEAGWLDFSAGSAAKNVALTSLGEGYLRQAIDLAPRRAAPRLYYAIVAASTPGNRALATREFRIFLSLQPSPAQLAVARPFLLQFGLSR